MRVLYVIEFENMRGGMQRSVEMLIRYITTFGAIPAVMLPCHGETADAYARAGARVLAARPGAHRWVFTSKKPLAAVPTLLQFGRQLRRTIRLFRPDVIHTQHTTAEVLTAAACRLNGIRTPRVFSLRGNVYQGVMKHALRRALPSARGVTLITGQQRQVACDVLRVDSRKVVEIPNATDLHLRPRAQQDLRRQWGVPPGSLVVSIVGFPSPLKCQETLIEAAAKTRSTIPNATFVIVGGADGASHELYLAKLRRMTSQLALGDRVLFAGYCPDTHSVMDATDVLVSTSLSEGFGRTIIEAWACGKPVIATRCGGPQCLIQHGLDGYLIELRDAQALAEHLTELARAPHLRHQMGQAGLAKVRRKYDARVIAKQYLNLYRAVVAGAASK